MRRSTIHKIHGLIVNKSPNLLLLRTFKNTKISEKDSNGLSIVEVDELGIPTQPVWSVHELLSSYPRPSIPSAKLDKLHELSALIPPENGSEERAKLTEEIEEMIRLVEAVKLVDCDALSKTEEQSDEGRVPDGRVPSVLEGTELTSNTREVEFDDPDSSGRALLKYAAKTKDAYYIVEQERKYRR